MRILVAHSGKQHSFRMATALKKGNMLDSYVTTVYLKPNNLTYLILGFISGKDKNKAKQRRCENLSDDEVVQFNELPALLKLLFIRLGWKRLQGYVDSYIYKRFGKQVAKMAIRRDVDAVVMYDNIAVPCFKYIKKHASYIKCVLDASTVNRLYIRTVYEKDMCQTHTSFFRDQLPFLWNSNSIQKYKDEINLSDYILLPSKFVEKSYLFSGTPVDKLIHIPYGADLQRFNSIVREPHSLPIELIYVGQITYYKGLHHLLPIIRDRFEDRINLTLVGGYDSNDYLYQAYKDVSNIHFLGYITNDKLQVYYQKADAFILPSLGEGLALVSLEALASGLPVLGSCNCGGNDAIIDGYNGYVFEAGNDNDMVEKIDCFINNIDHLHTMSENAAKSAQKYSWDVYEAHVIDFFNKHVGK